MSQPDKSGQEPDGDDMVTNDIWISIADDIDEIVPGEADIRISELSDDAIELRILPTGVGEELETRHAELSTTVHRAFQIVITRD